MNFDEFVFHPLAELFPLMGDTELAELEADIALHGQREPIYFIQPPDGGKKQIADGRNRWTVHKRLGIEPKVQPVPAEIAADEAALLALIMSLNFHRRHLTREQRIAIVDSRSTPRRAIGRLPARPRCRTRL